MNYLLSMEIIHYVKQWPNNKCDVFFVWSWFGSNEAENILPFHPEINDKINQSTFPMNGKI